MTTPATTPARIPRDVIPLPADIASVALSAKGGTITHAMDAIAYTVAAHRFGDWNPLRWNALLREVMYGYRMYASVYIDAHFSGRYNIWDGLTFDDLNTGDARQLLGHLVEHATKEITESASGTATTHTITKENEMIAMKNDTRNDQRPPIDYYFTAEEVAAHATAAGAGEVDVIDAVSWMCATDLLVGHHPLIPFDRVRDDIANFLTMTHRNYTQNPDNMTWDWELIAHNATRNADDHLLQGILVERARLHGEATARLQVGAIITERAALRIWPEGTAPSDRYNPDSLARYEALRDERDRIVSEALAWAEKCTTHNPDTWDVNALDLLTTAETKLLIEHLNEVSLTRLMHSTKRQRYRRHNPPRPATGEAFLFHEKGEPR
ncbi:hypothetical protein ABZ912_05565 [Nonomuraea angiospora]|uniref:hypothetical protein n=1 Tax=Nonomuraea angiospora TaxID=46172 RepID=UPI0034015693